MTDPSTVNATCPTCRERLWRRTGGDWTLHQRILKLDGDRFVAICPKCKTEVPVPFLRLETSGATPETVAPAARRYVVRVDVAR